MAIRNRKHYINVTRKAFFLSRGISDLMPFIWQKKSQLVFDNCHMKQNSFTSTFKFTLSKITWYTFSPRKMHITLIDWIKDLWFSSRRHVKNLLFLELYRKQRTLYGVAWNNCGLINKPSVKCITFVRFYLLISTWFFNVAH